MKKAIITLDFINDIIHGTGKLRAKGYAAFAEERNVFGHTRRALMDARAAGYLVFHVKVGFSAGYHEQPKGSKLFGKADQFGALVLHTWATEFHEAIGVTSTDHVITKHRVSPFYGTPLESILRVAGVEEILLCGCATDLVVSAAARDAHDRDIPVVVLADCCAAGSLEDHEHALATINKFASVIDSTAMARLL